MGTTVEYDQAPPGLNHQALLVGKIVRQTFFLIDSVQIIAQSNSGVFRFAVRDKPDAITDLIDTAHVLYVCIVLVQDAAPDTDICEFSFLDAEAVFTAPSSYNQVLFVEKSRFSALHISVRRASVMDISLHQVLK